MKTETKHTPGPWTVAEGPKPFQYEIWHRPGDGLMSMIGRTYTDTVCLEHHGDGISNARLIAAAPDMLNTLGHLIDVMERIGPPKIKLGGLCEEEDWNNGLIKARAAIRKATGGENE